MEKQKKSKSAWFHSSCLLGLLGWTSVAVAQMPEAVSEKDFLGDMPIVLSVSRLPQRLDETPGAVTIIDRNMIRLSGVRDVADLMRLVPGFRVSDSFEAGAPQVGYHNNLTTFSNRIQVMVDGRSVYSPFMLGHTGTGLQTVAIDDIERIEVLRGSNSAAYGARAFLGTINIVTRDPVDTLGFAAHLARGDNGINDSRASVGWASEIGNFRLGVDRRADNGLDGSGGPDVVSRFNFRGDVRLGAADQVEVRAGKTSVDGGVGFEKNIGNAPRQRVTETTFAQLDWRRNLNADQDLAVGISHADETNVDHFPYVLLPGLILDFGGRATTDQFNIQHTFRHGSNLRVVWGAELRQERVTSQALYNTDETLATDFTRYFGNAEWRIRPDLLLNVGGLYEKSSMSGDSFSPRVMFNWHMAEGQTLRWGVSQAQRPPTTFEKFSNVVYSYAGVPIAATWISRGGVRPEKVLSREIGYLGDFPRLGLNLDVRLFNESVQDSIKYINYQNPIFGQVADFANVEDFTIQGIEYQLKCSLWRGAQLILNQSLVDSSWTDGGNKDYKPQPYLSSGLMLMQKMPGGVDFSLMYHQADATNYAGIASMAPATSRTDVRFGWPVRMGNKRGDVSFVVQNLGPAYSDFVPALNFRRQAFVMLKLEN